MTGHQTRASLNMAGTISDGTEKNEKTRAFIKQYNVNGLLALTVLILLATLLLPVNAQALEIEWKRNFGGTGDDRFASVTATPDGLVAVGWSRRDSFDSGDWEGVTAIGEVDAIIVKYDNDGSVIWRNNFGSDGTEKRFTYVTAASTGFAAVGWSEAPSSESINAIIVKYDNSGSVVWQNNFGGGCNDQFTSVTPVSGGFIAVGRSSPRSFGSGSWEGITGNGGQEAIIVKYDNDGNIVWKNNFGGAGDDRFNSVTATYDGIVAVGWSWGSSFGSGDWANVTARGHIDAIIVKYDNSGNIVWKNNFGGRDEDGFTSVTTVSTGFVAVGRSFGSSFGSGDWEGVERVRGIDAIIVKFDNSGNIVWRNNFGGGGNDQFTSVTPVSGGFTAVGWSNANSFGRRDWAGVTGKGNADAIIVKYDNNGNVVWKSNFGGDGGDHFDSVTTSPTGVVAVGWAWGSSFGSGDLADVTGRGGEDAIIVRYSH